VSTQTNINQPTGVSPDDGIVSPPLEGLTEGLIDQREHLPAPHLRPGIRLERFEVFNWGGFHNAVWGVDLNGGNGLLTGANGAGKSTLVDGLSTLFLPANRITYNEAAGASRGERTLASYVLGKYGTNQDAETGMVRPTRHRKPGSSTSVLLMRFSNAGRTVGTAGVLLTFSDPAASTPSRLFFIAPHSLSISEHLVGHRDMKSMRTALRALGAQLFPDNFGAYQRALCQMLKIPTSALDLFATAVSMKQVGDLTDFVRNHMLEATDVDARVQELLADYENLTAAHDRVVDARQQRDALDPIESAAKDFEHAFERENAITDAVDALPSLANTYRRDLLVDQIARLEQEIPLLREQLAHTESQRNASQERREQLSAALRTGPGAELESAERAVADANARLAAVERSRTLLADLAGQADLEMPKDAAAFTAFRARATSSLEQVKALKESASALIGATEGSRSRVNEQISQTEAELRSVGTRDSNIALEKVELRDELAHALGLTSQDLPYAGELIAVQAEHQEWEAAAERMLRPFATSLLVPAQHGASVAAWVDARHLGQRLEFHVVPVRVDARVSPSPGSLAEVLQVRPDTPLSDWVSNEVARRYPHIRVNTAHDMAQHHQAVTKAGQVKDGRRHVKDDRRSATDRSMYVLGWDTKSKRDALSQRIDELQRSLAQTQEQRDAAWQDFEKVKDQESALRRIDAEIISYEQVDVASASKSRTAAQEHLQALAADPQVEKLRADRDAAAEQVNRLEKTLADLHQRIGAQTQDLQRCTVRLENLPPQREVQLGPVAQSILDDTVARVEISPDSLERVEEWLGHVRRALDRASVSARGTRHSAWSRLLTASKDFAARWPQRVQEIDVSSDEGYKALLSMRTQLISDDLPRFESDFKRHLEENAIRGIAVFSTTLEEQSRQISKRVDFINSVIAGIDYRPGTYMRLLAERTADPAVRDFQRDLQQITADTMLGDGQAYSEERFTRVRDLLDRLRGREGTFAADQSWRAKVTDVRAWFSFAASERRRADDVEIEFYQDSSGKSGGQKERLAYLILAASLAYQYGVHGNAERTGSSARESFRFVMIDEAFGRGDYRAATYALRLFESLGLQLLTVTPLEKIHVIDDYVDVVALAAALNGERNQVVTMTVSEAAQHLSVTGSANGAAQ
jgi:uncharacterized protein YPO0396